MILYHTKTGEMIKTIFKSFIFSICVVNVSVKQKGVFRKSERFTKLFVSFA
jgi:hypothetical protein